MCSAPVPRPRTGRSVTSLCSYPKPPASRCDAQTLLEVCLLAQCRLTGRHPYIHLLGIHVFVRVPPGPLDPLFMYLGPGPTISEQPRASGRKRRGAGAKLSDTRMDSSSSRRYTPRIASLDKKLVRKRAPVAATGGNAKALVLIGTCHRGNQ